ncbi:MAG: glycosyltransferase family 39 protein [Bacteroidia bacterium]|nr:glycosyltransferase family 39 protein [Bacteroidia bacterium]
MTLPFILIVIIGSLLFLPFLGSVHLFDWDEINFAESAREMIVTGNYSAVQINFEPFWEKPPLFFWFQVLSMKLFGVNEFAARFPDAICGIITLCFIYYIGKRQYKGNLAAWWVLCYLGSILPHFYFKSGIIDPIFNLFIFAAIYQFYLAAKQDIVVVSVMRYFFLAGIFTGLAILTKGPVALIICLLTLFIFVAVKRFTWFFRFKHLLVYGLIALFITSFWFVPETIKNGPWFLVEFVKYQAGLFTSNIAGHQQPFWYHTAVLLVGCFPISFIALAAIKKNNYYSYQENLFRTLMIVLFFVVLILFSIVKTKIVHYSSMCWLPLTFLAAYAIASVQKKRLKFSAVLSTCILVFGIILSTVLIAIPVIFSNKKLKDLALANIKDRFTVANFSINTGWTGFEAIPGILLLAVVCTGFYFLIRKQHSKGFYILLTGITLIIPLIAIMVVPKIEKHTQGTAISFFESLKGKNCYIFHTGYKSYAPYFYAQIKPLTANDSLFHKRAQFLNQLGVKKFTDLSQERYRDYDDFEKDWLLNGNIDKPAYFIAKSHDQEGLEKQTGLIMLWEKGGFTAYKRMP